jgi:hypothetical protein
MSTKVQAAKKEDPIVEVMTLPTSEKLKARYERVKQTMSNKGLESLHAVARRTLAGMLDDLENQFGETKT